MPERIQRKRTKGWRMPPNTVSVTRPGPWGNYAGNTAADFQRWIDEMPNADRAFFFDKLSELRGKNLACYCPKSQPCHADILLKLANEH